MRIFALVRYFLDDLYKNYRKIKSNASNIIHKIRSLVVDKKTKIIYYYIVSMFIYTDRRGSRASKCDYTKTQIIERLF